MSATPRTIVIAAGGTAGHVVPALAVARALQAEGARVAFIGGDRAEAALVPAAGYELERIAVRGIDRGNPARAASALALAARAVPRARSILARQRPHAVLGGGGYVAAPVGLAAVAMRIPLVLTEADSHLGLANRMLAPFARRVCLAFPIEGRDGPRYRVTGRPIAGDLPDRSAARARLGLGDTDTLVLVFGGSLGARTINLAAVDAFADAPFRVLHVSGSRDHADLAGRPLGPRYELVESMPPRDFSAALAAADLVVARAGGSVFEIAASGVPAILSPYPFAAADHQRGNALWMADAGAAVIIDDAELDAVRIAAEVGALLDDRERLASMAAASRSLARPDAAREVAAEVLAAAAGAR